MRLIDADELKEWITAHCDIELEPVIEKEVLRVIDDQPTVIDMDKVIKSITNMEDKAVKRACEARRSKIGSLLHQRNCKQNELFCQMQVKTMQKNARMQTERRSCGSME